jgi:Arc/MetJ family transcription regulator
MSKRHTTVNLDEDLLRDAMEVLGTKQITDTIHRALREVVDRRRLEWLLAHDLPDLTPEALEKMRAPRTFPEEPRPHAKSA